MPDTDQTEIENAFGALKSPLAALIQALSADEAELRELAQTVYDLVTNLQVKLLPLGR